MSDVSHARSAERYRNDAKSRNADNGFRLVCGTTRRAAPASAPPPPKPAAVQQQQPSRAAPAPPPHYSGAESRGFNPFGIVVTIGFGLIAYKVIRSILGAFNRPHPQIGESMLTPREAAEEFAAQPPPLAQRFAFQMTDSGFYINGPESAVGSQIQYTADLGDRVLSDDIVFSPGPDGQFIFTGVRPKSVRVQTTGGELGTTGGFVSASNFDDDHETRRRRFDSSSSHSSFPSAY